MDTLIHSLENGLSRLTIKKRQSKGNTTKPNLNDSFSLLLPMNTDTITSLNLSGCNLTDVPDWFTFKNLTDVDFSYNQFESVPYLIYANKKIQTLNLSNNKLANFDAKPKCCSFLVELNLSDNNLVNIPSWICSIDCDDLETLKLNNNPFEHRTQLLGRYLKKLRLLEMNNSNVRLDNTKSRFLIEIPKLEQLHICNVLQRNNINFVQELNFENFAMIPFLKELHVTRLGISTIPEEFAMLEGLEVLNLNKNYISWFPPNFTLLINLRVLIVSENDLIALPADINKLKNLQKLLISDNAVGTLPPSIKELMHLDTLDLYNNDFTEDIMEIVDGVTSLTAFDCDQNLFDVNDETYNKKRQKLRIDNECLNRSNGPKIEDCEDSNDDYKNYEEMSDCSDKSFQQYCCEEIEAENWDTSSENSISDDMNLILPQYRFCVRDKPKIADVDPVYFEDAEYK